MSETIAALEEIDLHLTNRCQMRCRHCAFDAGRRTTRELPPSAWMRVLREARELRVRDVDLTGGEPLLYDHVVEVVCCACELGYAPTLQTNGLLLDDAMAGRLTDAGLRRVTFSVDGSAASHQWLRRDASQELALERVRAAVSRGWRVRITVVAMRRTMGALTDLIRWSAAEGVATVGIFAFTGQGRGADIVDEEMAFDGWRRLIEEVSEVAASFPSLQVIIEPAMGPLFGLSAPLPCPMAERGYLQIASDGRAYPCTMLMFSDLYVLNITTDSLYTYARPESWRSLNLETWRAVHGCPGYDVYRTGRCGMDPRVERLHAPAFPLCPLLKLDLASGHLGLRSAHLLSDGVHSDEPRSL
jgi:MoaA/NifB/PqqE/SkfB family radical SAM enzyme